MSVREEMALKALSLETLSNLRWTRLVRDASARIPSSLMPSMTANSQCCWSISRRVSAVKEQTAIILHRRISVRIKSDG
jgi:hypothetical protein